MKLKELIHPNGFDAKSTGEMPLPGINDKKSMKILTKATASPKTASIVDTKTGKVYTKRTIYTK